jgi:hypothetical protein
MPVIGGDFNRGKGDDEDDELASGGQFAGDVDED